jgi:hypothetical protein
MFGMGRARLVGAPIVRKPEVARGADGVADLEEMRAGSCYVAVA